MLADRIAQLKNELGLAQIDICQLVGVSKANIAVQITRENKGELVSGRPGQLIFKMADDLMHNVSWFTSDGDYLRWNPEMVKAQRELRKWARKVQLDTPRQRLAATWEKLHQLAPSLREEVWATYLHWSEFERTGHGNEEYVAIHYEDWRRCKTGEVEPGEMQIKGAAMLTGLPAKWFLTGDTQYLEELDNDDLRYLGTLIRERGWEVDDLIRIATSALSPR